MKTIRRFFGLYWRQLCLIVVAVIGVGLLLGFRLGTLTKGMSYDEYKIATTPVGWHAIKQQPLYLPLELLRSASFKLRARHGALVVRLPDVFFGALAIASVYGLLKVWHGTRTALFGGVLFATAAWTLHASRLGGTDAIYLCALPVLFLSGGALHRYYKNPIVYYGSMLLWGVSLYIPGLVWFIALTLWLARKELAEGWQHHKAWWQRTLYVIAGLIWLPLLVYDFVRHVSDVKLWLGAPAHLPSPVHFLKAFAGVFVHLFVRGPEYPQLWLGRLPVLDVFTLIMCLFGIYFYARHFGAKRTRVLASAFVLGAFLVALGGPVSLSILVPLLYIFAAAGIAWILRKWLAVFPVNPLARNFGLIVIIIAVCVSSAYNLRSYFIAWPNDPTTQAVFDHKE